MQFSVVTEQEEDGRWIAEVNEIPGVMKYGQTRDEAIALAEGLALRVSDEIGPRMLTRIAKHTGLKPEDL